MSNTLTCAISNNDQCCELLSNMHVDGFKSANNVDEPYFHDGRWYIQCLYRIELNTLW